MDGSTYQTRYTEPPILSRCSEEELRQIASEIEAPLEISRLPCHNQGVERTIKLVSESSTKEDREGIVHSVLASRSDLPKF